LFLQLKLLHEICHWFAVKIVLFFPTAFSQLYSSIERVGAFLLFALPRILDLWRLLLFWAAFRDEQFSSGIVQLLVYGPSMLAEALF
jgi:hypothetical protein